MEYRCEANLGAVEWKLTAEQVAHLDAASHPGLPYPYEHIATAQARRDAL